MTIVSFLCAIFVVACYFLGLFLGARDMRNYIIRLIESRISEIIGDAQPKPALRAELEELIKRIKDDY